MGVWVRGKHSPTSPVTDLVTMICTAPCRWSESPGTMPLHPLHCAAAATLAPSIEGCFLLPGEGQLISSSLAGRDAALDLLQDSQFRGAVTCPGHAYNEADRRGLGRL